MPAERKSNAMPRYLISFDDGSMGHIPDEDLPAGAMRRIRWFGRRSPPVSGSSAAGSSASNLPSLRRTDHHSWSRTGDKGSNLRVFNHRSAFSQRGACLAWQ